MAERPKLKDRLTCPGCKKEIVNKERVVINKCPHCGQTLFAVQWLEKEVVEELSNSLEVGKLHEQGNAFLESGKIDDAIRCYDKALSLEPENADIWLNKGTAYKRLDRISESLACTEKALSIDPKNALGWTNKGSTLSLMEKKEAAIACFNKAIELDSGYTKAWYGKGLSLYFMEKTPEAVSCFKKAISLGDANAKNAMKELGLTQYLEADKPDKNFMSKLTGFIKGKSK